jgi:hypothetical protein
VAALLAPGAGALLLPGVASLAHAAVLARWPRVPQPFARATSWRAAPVAAPRRLRLVVLGAHGELSARSVPVAGALELPAEAFWSQARAARLPRRAGPRGPRPSHGRGRPPAPAVLVALRRLARAGSITSGEERRYASQYAAALGSLRRLSGTRRSELGAVLANVQAMAAAGDFSASRLPAIFETLARNRQWWSTGPLISPGTHLSFPGSRLVWEYYAGQGIEIQWLATFGEANGYYDSGRDSDLRELLREALALASARAGGITWEYLFRFDGGAPPWASGLTQGTALQVLARAWSHWHEAVYLTSAERALALFETPPPGGGVRVAEHPGVWYAQYTFAPDDHVINGFIQSLVGLYEFTALTGNAQGQALFEAGDAQARVALPHFDTGAWSRYDQYSESSLSYHELLDEFLQHLCERTQTGEPLERWRASSAAGHRARGSAPGTSAPGASAPRPVPGDAIYCTTARRFARDLHTPPKLTLLTHTLTTGARAGVQIALSKISNVSLTVRSGRTVVWTTHATLESGHPRLLWDTPRRPGAYEVSLSATDLAGNRASTTGTVALRTPKRGRPRPSKPRPGAPRRR